MRPRPFDGAMAFIDCLLSLLRLDIHLLYSRRRCHRRSLCSLVGGSFQNSTIVIVVLCVVLLNARCRGKHVYEIMTELWRIVVIWAVHRGTSLVCKGGSFSAHAFS